MQDLERYDEAVDSFDQSINISPNSSVPWNSRDRSLESMGRNEPANEAWKGLQDLSYSHITFSNNSGQSNEDAVIIMNATGEEDGVGSEYYYLEKRFGKQGVDWEMEMQSLIGGEDDRFYDKMDIRLSTGEMISIYFDITDFYGKWQEDLKI
jgi:tetratricopeptide (TPR) repeat protein